jgi:hypothetical protein
MKRNYIIGLFVSLLLYGCEGDPPDPIPTPVLPTLTTVAITNITSVSATGGGMITSDGGASVTARGICWSTATAPTITGTHTTDGSGTGSFASSMTGLTPNTIYYARTYATNSVGTSYGNEITFTTLPASPLIPTLATLSITAITSSSASSGGAITADGGASVTSRGVCWNTSTGPTIANSHTTDGTGIGAFSSALSGLTANTTYFVRSYATNSAGTAYGNELSFTTSAATPANVYAAGSERVSANVFLAKTWKNGVATDLTNGSFDAQAASIYVSGTDVYACGYERNAGGFMVAKYWKNGVATSLTGGTTNARAFSIFVSGADVYVAGVERQAGGTDVARYWKNGTAVTLSNVSMTAYATGIFVSGANVYVCGVESNAGGKYVAKLWSNGVAFDLSDGTTNASVWGVYVTGADVYVAGEISNSSNVYQGKYWKNGVRTDLVSGSNCIGRSVFVAGTDVYVAGFQVIDQSRLWTNNVLTNLSGISPNTYANSVYVLGGDVYVTGAENDMPRIWKNGTGTTLSTNASRTGAAVAVFVTY